MREKRRMSINKLREEQPKLTSHKDIYYSRPSNCCFKESNISIIAIRITNVLIKLFAGIENTAADIQQK